MNRCVGLVARGEQFASGAVEALVAGLCFEERRDDLAVRVEHATQIRMRPRSRPIGIEEPELAGLVCGELPLETREVGEDFGVGEVPVAGVEVVVATHRPLRQV